MKIQQLDFPVNQYHKEITAKKQIVIHHTVSGDGINGDKSWWASTPDREGCHYIIDRTGNIYQLIKNEYWVSHLGLTTDMFKSIGMPYQNLNKSSIGIELDSWGPVLPSAGKFYPVKWDSLLKKMVPNFKSKPIQTIEEVCTPFRGYKYYELYSKEQLDSLKELLSQLCALYKIPRAYTGDSFWSVKSAMSGTPGVYGHVSFRKDKSDPYPDPRLIKLLENL